MDYDAIESWGNDYCFTEGIREIIDRLIKANDRTRLEATLTYLTLLGYSYKIYNAIDGHRIEKPWLHILIKH